MDTKQATHESALAEARRIGADHGEAAASWVLDGNTSAETCRRVLDGIEDGDPEVLDSLPSPDLSGEWADGLTTSSLAQECGVPKCDWAGTANDETIGLVEDCCTAYEDAFSTAVHNAIERECRRALTPFIESVCTTFLLSDGRSVRWHGGATFNVHDEEGDECDVFTSYGDGAGYYYDSPTAARAAVERWVVQS